MCKCGNSDDMSSESILKEIIDFAEHCDENSALVKMVLSYQSSTTGINRCSCSLLKGTLVSIIADPDCCIQSKTIAQEGLKNACKD